MNEICEKIKMCLCKKKGEKKKKKKNRDWIKMKVKKQFKEHLNQNESNGASCGQPFYFILFFDGGCGQILQTYKTLESIKDSRIL